MEVETLLGRSIIPVSDGDLEKRVRSRYPPYTGPTTPKLCASVSEYTDPIRATHLSLVTPQSYNITQHSTLDTMCVQTYRKYTCGCKKPEEFKQYAARLGTNVKCSPVTKEDLPDSVHMCSKHMVKEGKDEMHR